MENNPTLNEIYDACGVLFGPDIKISLDFLKYLRLSGIKVAYREKALETHPDRKKILGENESELNRLFITATTAYQKLCLAFNDQGLIPLKIHGVHEKMSGESNRKTPGVSDFYFKGSMPRKKLLIGQFLYYSRYISWKTYMNAIHWQRRQRPAIGQLARDWEMLSAREIHAILKDRCSGEKFGESALRKGFLTPYKLMALLGRQHKLQRPIGEFFVKNRKLTRKQLQEMVEKQRRHNRRFFSNKRH